MLVERVSGQSYIDFYRKDLPTSFTEKDRQESRERPKDLLCIILRPDTGQEILRSTSGLGAGGLASIRSTWFALPILFWER